MTQNTRPHHDSRALLLLYRRVVFFMEREERCRGDGHLSGHRRTSSPGRRWWHALHDQWHSCRSEWRDWGRTPGDGDSTTDAGDPRLGCPDRVGPPYDAVRHRSPAIAIAVLALLAGLVAALATSERQGATSAAWQNAEPLMVTAQAVDTALSDADTTAGASFLQGRLEPPALQRRYETDLALASADVAVAARQAGSDPAVSQSLSNALSTRSAGLRPASSRTSTSTSARRPTRWRRHISPRRGNLMHAPSMPAAALAFCLQDPRA